MNLQNFSFKETYDIGDLLEIMKILRAPGGCPWDREQTHESIRKCLIEETYEVVEAINRCDAGMLEEELGDVLLQVVFHAQIEQENGSFSFRDVADGICKKLIIRHPHVFADVSAETSEEVLKNWDDIKKETKGQKTQSDSMNSVPRELPALMRAQKVQQKAAKSGFDWDDVSGALDKLGEEISEFKEALESGDRAHIADELGDVLFSAVNVSRFAKLDAEESLTLSTDKFVSRFTVVEQLARQRGISMEDASLETLDTLWDEAKILLKNPRID